MEIGFPVSGRPGTDIYIYMLYVCVYVDIHINIHADCLSPPARVPLATVVIWTPVTPALRRARTSVRRGRWVATRRFDVSNTLVPLLCFADSQGGVERGVLSRPSWAAKLLEALWVLEKVMQGTNEAL